MAEPDPDRLDPWALGVMGASRVHDLRELGDETGALVAELLELPDITATDLTERETLLALMIGRKVELAKRLIALVV